MNPIYKLQDVSVDMKQQIVSVFNSEWGGAIVYTVDLLEKTWMRTEKDVLLVMIDPGSSDMVGTIGLDHKYLIPIAGTPLMDVCDPVEATKKFVMVSPSTTPAEDTYAPNEATESSVSLYDVAKICGR
eukprot:gene28879-biopygen32771